GGKVKRAYERHPHNIGHLLGIQVHDGDSSRSYKTTGLPEGAIITIEPGLYGEFEFNGECQHFGIRIEDNFVIKKNSAINLTQQIPKSCAEIEALLNG
ncbi:MAG: M24 family metallopeptidase, partial [Candidatus Margulisiibacteriota bacterium]